VLDVRLTGHHLWIQLHVNLPLPVCAPCLAYAQALHQADLRFQLILLIPAIAIGVALAAWGLNPRYPDGDWLAFGFGAVIAAVTSFWTLYWIATRTGVKARLLRRLAGEAPPGYASPSDMPGQVTGGARVRFYSPEFHRRFAALNPDCVDTAEADD